MRPDAGNIEGHPLIGTAWATDHFPYRVVMEVCRCSDGRLRARLTNNIPGMRSWRLLTEDGERVSGHRQVAPADPNIEVLASMFEGIDVLGPDGCPVGGPGAVAYAMRFPEYRDLPGSGDSNPKARVIIEKGALIALAHRIFELQQLVSQQAISTFDSPAAGYAPWQPADAALSDVEARLAAVQAATGLRPGDEVWDDGEQPDSPVPVARRDWCEVCENDPAGQRWLCPNVANHEPLDA